MYGSQIADILKSVRERTEPCTPVEWAEKNRTLSTAVTSRAGRVDYRSSPYLKEIVNNFDPRSDVREVAVIKGAQMGYSQLVLETCIGFTMANYPRSMLYLTGDQKMAEESMETRMDPMLVSAGLENKIKPSSNKKNNRSTGNTKSKKEFAGGVLYVKGANSPNSLRSISVPVLLFDEIDAIKQNLKGQGSPVDLGKSRTAAFERVRKIFYGSTPTTLVNSNIYNLYKQGDCRKWFVPCPNCGEYQVLSWNSKDDFLSTVDGILEEKKDFGVKFETDSEGNYVKGSFYYKCVNGCKIFDSDFYSMNLKGEWRPTQKSKKEYFRSYQLSSLFSNFSSRVEMINEFLLAKNDSDKLQVFTNNRLGEVWVEKAKMFDVTKLNKNVMNYESGTIPNLIALEHGNGKICVLVCAVDVNGSAEKNSGWLAVEVRGYCANGASYSVAKAEIHGYMNDTTKGVWGAVEEITSATFSSDDGIEYKIMSTFVDSGSRTQIVYDFTNRLFSNQVARCYAVKGVASKVAYNYRKQNQEKANAYNINVNKYKDFLYEYLQKDFNKMQKQPDFYLNFPKSEVKTGFESFNLEKNGISLVGGGYNERYFKTFASETREVIRDYGSGEMLPIGQWKKYDTRAYNHFWDVNVYLLGGLDIVCSLIGEHEDEKESNTFSILQKLNNYLEETGEPYY